MPVVQSIVGFGILMGILNRVLSAEGELEAKRTEAAIGQAEAPKALLNPLLQEGVKASHEEAMGRYFGTDPQELLTTVSRVRAGSFDEALPTGAPSALVEQIAARMGMNPQDIASRLNPGRAGRGVTLGRAAIGNSPV